MGLNTSGDDEYVFKRTAPVRPAPRDALLAIQREQQLQLGAEKHVAVALVEIEDWKGDV